MRIVQEREPRVLKYLVKGDLNVATTDCVISVEMLPTQEVEIATVFLGNFRKEAVASVMKFACDSAFGFSLDIY